MSNNTGLDNATLLDFLNAIDNELESKITLVAVGGTAMTLLKAKPSTIDVDFTIPGQYFEEFKKALDSTPHGFNVDLWNDGMVFSQILPEDYLDRAKKIRAGLKMVDLRALHPVDIIVTKIGRLIERDLEDIESCIKKFKITRSEIEGRARQVEYVGREENYEINLNSVLKKFF